MMVATHQPPDQPLESSELVTVRDILLASLHSTRLFGSQLFRLLMTPEIVCKESKIGLFTSPRHVSIGNEIFSEAD